MPPAAGGSVSSKGVLAAPVVSRGVVMHNGDAGCFDGHPHTAARPPVAVAQVAAV